MIDRQERISHRRRKAMIEEANQWIQANKIKAFYNLIDGVGFQDGIRSLVQASGFGKLSPNIVLMGYKPDWRSCNPKDLMEYFEILQ
jgi:solute carrier family 12 (sodium/potassium/chloride transporter), member 2